MCAPTPKEEKHLRRINARRLDLVEKKYGVGPWADQAGLRPDEETMLRVHSECMDAMDMRIHAPSFARMEQEAARVEQAVQLLVRLTKELTEAGIPISLKGAGGGDDVPADTGGTSR
jgi:hypothetical protein